MAVYQMQVQKFPTTVHKELDKCVRRCVWGSSEEKRTMHLITWEVLCRPKQRSSLGLKRAAFMNKALIAKLTWRLFTEEDAIWSRVLRAKYGLSLDDPPLLKPKARASIVWRSLIWLSDLFHRGLSWQVMNKRRVMFWTDKWMSDCELIQTCPVLVAEHVQSYKVSEPGKVGSVRSGRCWLIFFLVWSF